MRILTSTVLVSFYFCLFFSVFLFIFSFPFSSLIPTPPPPFSVPPAPPISLLCHFCRQGRALPSSASHPSRLPGSGSGRRAPPTPPFSPPAPTPPAPGLQCGPAEEQAAAEPWRRRCCPLLVSTGQHLRPTAGAAARQRGWCDLLTLTFL